MSSELDASEFVDDDFQAARKTAAGASVTPVASLPADSHRAPTREEVDSKVVEMQQKLAELKRTQQELERERALLEETRRRQLEFTTGREEMLQHLTRGVGLLEEAEFAARRDAEQMAKTLADFRAALDRIQAIREETWTKDSLNVELTRASTAVENARMEWNAARLKFSILSAANAAETQKPVANDNAIESLVRQNDYAALCKLGLALTWPLVLAGVAIVVALLLRMK